MKTIKNEKGFSLLELLLSLAIISALIVAAFIVYPRVKASNEVNQETKNLSAIYAASRELFSSSSDYSKWSLNILVKAKALPDNMIFSESTSEYRNAWGRNVKYSLYATPESGYTYTAGYTLIYEVSENACSKFITAVFPMVAIIKVAGTSIKSSPSDQIDVSKISENCAKPYTDDLVAINLTYFP